MTNIVSLQPEPIAENQAIMLTLTNRNISMEIKLDDLLSFVATVRHRSISRAAEALGLTQPAVTRRVQNLEEALNLTLLDRMTKPPKPTVIGFHAYEQCIKILQEVEVLKSLAEQGLVPTGSLRLGLTQALADAGLATLLTDLHEQFPDLHPQAISRFSGELVKLIVSGELDVAAVSQPLHHTFPTGVNATLIGSLQVVIVAAKGRFCAKKLRLSDINDAGWVLNPAGCGIRKHLLGQLEERGLSLQIVTEAFGTDLQLKTVASGAGLGLLPAAFLPHSPYTTGLDILTVEDFSLQTGLWLLRQERSALSPKCLQLVTQALSKLIGG